MDELKIDFSVIVSSMKHMLPWNEDQMNDHLKNTLRSLLEKCSGGRTVEMLKSVLSIEERRALFITDDQFASQEEKDNTSKNLDKEKNVPKVLIPESSQDESNQNSVPTKNDEEMNSAISENVINENYISPTTDLTYSQDEKIQNLVPFEVKEIVSTQDTEMKEIKFFCMPFMSKDLCKSEEFFCPMQLKPIFKKN